MLNVLPLTIVYFETLFALSLFFKPSFTSLRRWTEKKTIQDAIVILNSAYSATHILFSFLANHAFPLFSMARH